MNPPNAPGGFSLLELLVALALFAVIGVLAYGGLGQIAEHSVQLDAQSQRLASVQRAMDRIASDLRAARQRPIRDASAGLQPALAGTPEHIEFTRAGYGNTLAQPRASLERLGYRLDGERLVRLHYNALDRPGARPDREDAMLDAVLSLRFSYRDRSGRGLPGWSDSDSMPHAVAVELELRDLGLITRLLELSDGVPP